jgi:hypothetical protein
MPRISDVNYINLLIQLTLQVKHTSQQQSTPRSLFIIHEQPSASPSPTNTSAHVPMMMTKR